MASGSIKAAQTTGSATRRASGSGELSWVKCGSVVTVAGTIELSATTSHGTELFSGLPSPKVDYVPLPVHNSTTGYHFSSFLRNTGSLRNSEQWASGSLFRISGSYVAAD